MELWKYNDYFNGSLPEAKEDGSISTSDLILCFFQFIYFRAFLNDKKIGEPGIPVFENINDEGEQ